MAPKGFQHTLMIRKNLRNAHIINKSYKTADGVRQFGQKRSFCPKGEAPMGRCQ